MKQLTMVAHNRFQSDTGEPMYEVVLLLSEPVYALSDRLTMYKSPNIESVRFVTDDDGVMKLVSSLIEMKDGESEEKPKGGEAQGCLA